jgi:hypothetical protein
VCLQYTGLDTVGDGIQLTNIGVGGL